jgi:hypothetical protein
MPNEKKSVAVDLDGVIAQYDGWKGVENIGDPMPGAREFLAKLREKFKVIIHTTRVSTEVNKGTPREMLIGYVAGWLAGHDLPFDEIWFGEGKPIAVAYIDDRAVSCRPQDYTDPIIAFQNALTKVEHLA